MSEERKKSRAWIWCVALLLVLYPVSILPVALACRWAIRFGIVSPDFDHGALEDFYDPVLSVMELSPALDNGLERALEALGAPPPP